MLQLNELDKVILIAYENAKLYKIEVKWWPDRRILPRTFEPGQAVLLYNSRLRLFSGKLKSRWSGPFFIKMVYPHGAVDIYRKNPDVPFKVNGKRFKHYYRNEPVDEGIPIPLSTPWSGGSLVKLMTIKKRLLGGNPVISIKLACLRTLVDQRITSTKNLKRSEEIKG